MSAPNPKKLSVFWSQRAKDWMYRFPRSWDGHYLHNLMHEWREAGVLKELEQRGYDLKTLRIEITRKDQK